MRCGDKGEGGGDDFACELHALHADLQGERAVVEQADVFGAEIAFQLFGVALEDWAVVGQPGIVPDFLQPRLVFFQGGKEWFGDVDGFRERGRHKRFYPRMARMGEFEIGNWGSE